MTEVMSDAEHRFWMAVGRKVQVELDEPIGRFSNGFIDPAIYLETARAIGGDEQVAITSNRLQRLRKLGLAQDQAGVDPDLQPRGRFNNGNAPSPEDILSFVSQLMDTLAPDDRQTVAEGLAKILADEDGGDGTLEIRHSPDGNDQGLPQNNTQVLDRGHRPGGRRSALDAQIRRDERLALDRRIQHANADHAGFQSRFGDLTKHIRVS